MVKAKPIHIIYADDDEDEHIFFRECITAITEFTCTVTSAYNGAEVLDEINKSEKSGTNPETLVIADLNMPVIDGYTLLAQAKRSRQNKNIPIYILSVSDKEPDRKRCETLGCKGFYTKPANFSKLTAVIRDILEKEFAD